MEVNLERFISAQEKNYDTAFVEIKSGRKRSHWMWYIFPQLKELGYSSTAKFYGINNLQEASAFLSDPILGENLLMICEELLKLEGKSAFDIFGNPDDKKLRSCMTLFYSISKDDQSVFMRVIDLYFEGELDCRTLKILNDKTNDTATCNI